MRVLPVVPVLLLGAAACAPPSTAPERTVEIVANDYSFLAPDTVTAGPAVLRLMNHGQVPHEVIVMRLRPGSTVADLFAAQQRGESFRDRLIGGNAVLFAQPGAVGDGRLLVDFEAGGEYVLWCNFQDSDELPRHSDMGMFRQLHVADPTDDVPAHRPVRRVVVDAADYVFTAPDTLPAGETDFVMINSGAQRHEISFGRLKAGTSPAFFFSEYMNGNDIDALLDDDGAILTAYGGEGNEFAVRIDLLEGRSYVLLCEFSDTPEAPLHAEMGMFRGIEVRNPSSEAP